MALRDVGDTVFGALPLELKFRNDLLAVWTDVDLEYEPSIDDNQPFVRSEQPFEAGSLGRTNYPVHSPRQDHFEAQLLRLAQSLKTAELPVFISWNGQRLRMDKGCVGHAVANGVMAMPADDPSTGYVTHVRLISAAAAEENSSQGPLAAKRVWLKAFWGFNPGEDGYLGFTRPGDRDRLIREWRPGDLVLIYGADNPETDQADRRQALGFLEVEPIPVTDHGRSSEAGWARKVERGYEGRWDNAMPVRRAWQVERRIEVRHIAPETYTPARARTIASQGELLTEDEAFLALQLPVLPVNVFGEPPVEMATATEATMSMAYAPSRGFPPTFGGRESQYEDGPSRLYMLIFDGDGGVLLGRPVGTRIVVKVGYSNDPDRRCADHNSTLPPAARTRWRLSLQSRAFPSGVQAKEAEDAMKSDFARRFESLGGEFFLGQPDDLESAFVAAARPAAFVLQGATQRT